MSFTFQPLFFGGSNRWFLGAPFDCGAQSILPKKMGKVNAEMDGKATKSLSYSFFFGSPYSET